MRQRLRPSGPAANTTVLPLVVVVAALAAALLMVAIVVTGIASTGGGSTPAWSGDQAPPGAVGLSPEQTVLRADQSH